MKNRWHIDGYDKYKIILFTGDAVALAVAFFLSYTLRNYFFAWRGGVYVPTLRHIFFLAGMTVLILIFFRDRSLYRELAFRKSQLHLETLTYAWLYFVSAFIVICFFFKVKLFLEHRITVTFFVVLGWVGLYISRFQLVPRIVGRRFSREKETPRNVIIVGAGLEAQMLAKRIEESYIRKVKVVGFIDDTVKPPAPGEEKIHLLGNLKSIPDIVRQYDVSEVFVYLPAGQESRIIEVFDLLNPLNVHVRVAISHFGVLRQKVPYLPEVEEDIVFLTRSPFVKVEVMLKRAIDIFGSLAGIILLSPFFLIMAFLIKIDSKGPVFFRQKRAGRGGKEFEIFKFRSMKKNTESFHQEAVRSLAEGDEGYFKEKSGKRNFFKVTDGSNVTKVGRWLRGTSLDELPQIINVLRGEMSLVGPRPLPLYEVELLKPWQRYRHNMRPAITGFWQVFGRSAVSHEDMMLMDIFYITNWSLALDIRILRRTFFVVLTGKGAL